MSSMNVVPECYVDTRLAEILSETYRKFNHQHGHGNVANKMQVDLINYKVLGIIDEDTIKVRKATYFNDFITIKTENNTIIKKHSTRPHFLLIISPQVEVWLLENALIANIDPELYLLPKNLKSFTQISKIKDIRENVGFKRFVKALIQKEAPGIITFQRFLNEFLSSNF